MAKYRVTLDRDECIGCGTCEATCPEHWELGEDGKTNLKNSREEGNKQVKEMEDLECNLDAAEVCPVNCIHIEENDEKII